MRRWLFTVVAAAVGGAAGYFVLEYFLRNGVAIPRALLAQGATPHNVGVCAGIVTGAVGAAWGWGIATKLR